ncbi:cop9 signalosome complex subunit 3 [Echinococcus multilocularis]|uniref:COP9 signalosome complex subunit 3 n=1 Tax=Echinococcus multilocularis TaxID=6211 RepID=A0A068Y2L0_ECHMU|nr:cop9 signalosome complex subunit 3 [Echinococcus multilocularis]
MDQLIASIKKAGDNGPEIVAILEKHSDFLMKNVSSLDLHLARYETDQWTCLYAAVIRAKLMAASSIEPTHLIEAQTFFEASDSKRLNLVKPIVRAIGRILTKKLIAQSIAISGIPVLIAAIKRIQDTANHLTCLHVNLCQLALSAKFFNPLLSFLNADLLDVDNDRKAYCIKDAILYFYYGGMIYAALKMWDRSFKFFTMACSIPTPSCSSLLLAAAKKLIIISLIHKGEFNVAEFPLLRRWKYSLEAYKKLEEAFSASNSTALGEVIEKNSSTFGADRNYGLVKQLIDCHVKYRIRSLTKTFISLSVKDLAVRARLDLPETAEKQLLEMAGAKSIFVKIDQRNGCVRFLDNPERYESPEVLDSLVQKLKAIMDYDMTLRRIISEEASTTALGEPCVKLRRLAIHLLESITGQQSSGLPVLSTPACKRKHPSE